MYVTINIMWEKNGKQIKPTEGGVYFAVGMLFGIMHALALTFDPPNTRCMLQYLLYLLWWLTLLVSED